MADIQYLPIKPTADDAVIQQMKLTCEQIQNFIEIQRRLNRKYDVYKWELALKMSLEATISYAADVAYARG